MLDSGLYGSLVLIRYMDIYVIRMKYQWYLKNKFLCITHKLCLIVDCVLKTGLIIIDFGPLNVGYQAIKPIIFLK